jgi:hypothetical protein
MDGPTGAERHDDVGAPDRVFPFDMKRPSLEKHRRVRAYD